MDATEVAKERIRNSGLGAARFSFASEVVRCHGAMQAQDYGPAKWSIAQRTVGVTSGDVDDLLTAGEIVRTHILRPTWHFVAAHDLMWLLRLTGPRVQRGMRSRLTQLGLDPQSLAKAEKVIEKALAGGRTLTRKELASSLENSGLSTEGQRMPHILMHCELEALVCSGGFEGNHHTYALVADRGIPDVVFTTEEATAELARRYLGTHGPASVKDMSWWSGLTVTSLRAALADLGDAVSHETVEGIDLWSLAEGPAREQVPPSIDLLQTYDEMVVGYTESRYLGDPQDHEARSRFMGAGSAPHNLVLYGGHIVGYWRRTIGKNAVGIDVHLHAELDGQGRAALEEEAAALGRFLALEHRLQVAVP